MNIKQIIFWILRIVAAIILLQTLWFKFMAAPESVYIFTKVGIEPWGRIGTGIMELIASLLILIPRTSWLGALLGLGIMAGALASHFLILGIDVQGDGGTLFSLALIVFICCLNIVWFEKLTILNVVNNLKNSNGNNQI